MRVKNKAFAFVVVVILFSFNIGAQGTYIKDEKLLGVAERCEQTDFIEIGNFTDAENNIVRHCIQRAAESGASNNFYVTNSYFEVEAGHPDCQLYGGNNKGSFQGRFNNNLIGPVNLCVYTEAGNTINFNEFGIKNVTINSTCPTDYTNTGITVDLSTGKNIVHCVQGGRAGQRRSCYLYEGAFSSIITPNTNCNYKVGSVAGPLINGSVVQGNLTVGDRDICPNVNCTCMSQGFGLTNGWNCTAASEVVRSSCSEGYHGEIPGLQVSQQCLYDLNPPIMAGGSPLGFNLSATINSISSGNNCPNVNCTCVPQGFASTNGWNCTSVDSVSMGGNECLFSNLKWKDGEGKNDISSIPEKEKALLYAEVSDVCELEREVECAVYKYEEGVFQDAEHPQGHSNGVVSQKEDGPKRAYCEWTALKLPGTEEDTDQQYYFKIWFANNVTYKVKSENIEILNETIIELPQQPITINWSTSQYVDRSELCPEDKFVIKIARYKMWCAEFTKSDESGEIFWGERRTVKGTRDRTQRCEGLWGIFGHRCPAISCDILGHCEKLECGDNEAVIQSKDEYELECAVMEDEEGTLVEMGDIKRRDNSGCGKDGVVVAAKKDIEFCAIGLVLGGEGREIDDDSDDDSDEDSNEDSGSEAESGLGGQGNGFMDGLKDIWTWIAPIVAPFLGKIFGGLFR